MIAAASWPHSQHRSDNLRASTIGVRQHTSRKYSALGVSINTEALLLFVTCDFVTCDDNRSVASLTEPVELNGL